MSQRLAHNIPYLRGQSPEIWKRLNRLVMGGGFSAVHFADDFLGIDTINNQTAAGTASANGLYETYADANETISEGTGPTVSDPSGFTSGSNDEKAGYDVDTDWAVGTWTFACTGTNGECGIHTQNFWKITQEQLRPCAYEARFALSSVTNPGVFVGLSNIQPDDSALVDSTGEIEANAAALGFSVLDADGDALRPTISENGGTITRYGTAALTAAKFIKAGWLLDPQAEPSKRVKFFISGVEQSTYITQAILEGANFPEDSAMGLTVLAKATGATNFTLTMDWHKFVGAIDAR